MVVYLCWLVACHQAYVDMLKHAAHALTVFCPYMLSKLLPSNIENAFCAVRHFLSFVLKDDWQRTGASLPALRKKSGWIDSLTNLFNDVLYLAFPRKCLVPVNFPRTIYFVLHTSEQTMWLYGLYFSWDFLNKVNGKKLFFQCLLHLFLGLMPL